MRGPCHGARIVVRCGGLDGKPDEFVKFLQLTYLKEFQKHCAHEDRVLLGSICLMESIIHSRDCTPVLNSGVGDHRLIAEQLSLSHTT